MAARPSQMPLEIFIFLDPFYFLSKSKTTVAHFCPESNIAPNVGPIRGRPKVVVTLIPQTTNPGCTSLVCSTTKSSERSTHIAPKPGILIRPRSSNFLTTQASCPVASTSTFVSKATGSTQVISRGKAVTGVQFTTTPATRLSSRNTTSSKIVILANFTPASQAAAISLEQACGPSATNKPLVYSLYGIPNSFRTNWPGSLTVSLFIKYPPIQ